MPKQIRWPFPDPYSPEGRPILLGWVMSESPDFVVEGPNETGEWTASAMTSPRPRKYRVRLGQRPESDRCDCAHSCRGFREESDGSCRHSWGVRFRRGDYSECTPPVRLRSLTCSEETFIFSYSGRLSISFLTRTRTTLHGVGHV